MANDNVKIFPGITPFDLDPDIMLDKAKDQLKNVVIIGYKPNGDFFFSSSLGGGPEVLWLLEQAKKALFDVASPE